MYGALDVSTSGMIAQRTRVEAIATNIANKDTVLDSKGNVNPYRRRVVHFASGDPTARTPAGKKMGVHVAAIEEDRSPYDLRYDPESPYAFKSGPNLGYVPVPNINPAFEQINAMEAVRAYEANVAAAEASKSMVAQALRLLA